MQAPFSTNRRKRFHFIGIGGIGMSALARILLDKKYWVQGSDRNKTAIIKELEEQGAVIYDKQTARNISKADIVVYSSAISQNNSEFEAAEALGCKMMHRSQLLAELASEKKGIAIAGTHGKTTTSSMLTAILLEAKLSPSYAIGGLLGKKNGERGQGGHFLFEADESDGSLVNYEPDCAVITSVDAEHMDHYKTKETLLECYESFASKVKDQLFYCGDDHQFALGSSYGFSEACDYTISNFRQKGWKLFFDLGEYEEIEVMATGRHNACNAAAAFLMARHLEIPISVIRSALKGFGGVSRRCERRSEKASVLRIDDYAHHPTEVHTALRGIKEAVGSRRIVALFQPHRYCRTQDHLEQFKRAFEWADCVYITDIFQAREKAIPFLSAHSVIEIVDHPDCRYIPREECDQIELRPHDVFVTLGAGDITSVEMKCEPKRWKVAVLAGGCSPEHEISLRSAQFVFDSLDEKLYERELIVLPEDGSWSEEALFSLRQAEVALPIMHGAYGEDGTIQGFLRTLKIPFAGSDHMACSLAMNKALSKRLAEQAGILTAPFVSFFKSEWKKERKRFLEHGLNYPVYVKGVHLGSSIGTYLVKKQEDLEEAIEKSFHFDDEVMIEEGKVACREMEFACLGNHDVAVPSCGEKLARGAFVDYEMKYGNEPVPTSIDPTLSKKCLEEGKKAATTLFHALRMSGLARVDFLLDSEDRWWFMEVNPIPGMQKLSLFPKIWNREGLSNEKLMDQLVILALERARV